MQDVQPKRQVRPETAPAYPVVSNPMDPFYQADSG